VAIAAVAAVMLGAVWYLKNGANAEAKPAVGDELTIADRKPVPKLKTDPVAAPSSAATTAPSATPATTTIADDQGKLQREQMEVQRRELERRMIEARLKSAIIPPNTNGQSTVSNPQLGEPLQQAARDPGGPAGSSERSAQDANSRYARGVSGNGVALSVAARIENLEYKVLQGKLIEAVLEPRAISDLPGTICATVQRDVFGAQGRMKLIPWGSRVCGVYSADLRKGQDRLFAVWNTVRRPDGVQVTLDSVGADQLGSAGMGGIVDSHFAEIFGISTLLSIIGAGAANVGVSSSDQYNSSAAYRQSVQQAAAQTSQQALQPYLNIPPTVTVPAGSRIRIYVNRDLDFASVYKDESDASQISGVTFVQ
ncbi:MAG: virB10, partial [Herminiimonas sp.]|nr:virB10 [Herminiimonas sp.]